MCFCRGWRTQKYGKKNRYKQMYKPLDQSIPNIKSTSVQFENAQIDLAQTDRKGRPLQYYF